MLPQGGEEDPPPPDTEINVQVENAFGNTITFNLSPVGNVFCRQENLCGDFQLYEGDINLPYTVSVTGNETSGFKGCELDGYEIRHCGEGNILEQNLCSGEGYGHLGPLRWGLYKIEIKEGTSLKATVYYDTREKGFPEHCLSNCIGNDITIRYDYENDEIKFYNKGDPDINFWPYTILENHSIVRYSDVKCSYRDYSPFWYAGLIAINKNGYPQLIWNKHPEDGVSLDIDGYYIYRSINSGSFYKIVEVDNETFDYIDYEYTYGGSTTANYKVTATWRDAMEVLQETNPTNIFSVAVSAYKKSTIEGVSDYSLTQNYPNPFNPKTLISYSIPTKGHVTLKIYDALGNEISTLVNGEVEAGSYEVSFDASKLSSGVYFYTIIANNFMQTNKMVLAK